MIQIHLVGDTTPTHCQRVTARCIESHGYQCIINGSKMYLLLPIYNSKLDIMSRQIVRVTSLKDTYKKMGY